MTYSSVFVDRADWKELIPDYDEVFRYMGYRGKDMNNTETAVQTMVFEVVELFEQLITPQGVYAFFPLSVKSDGISFEGNEIKSEKLAKFLEGCHSVCLFAATIGPKIDQQIHKTQKLNPARAVVMQAAGAMFIEKYCDLLCQKIKIQAEKENLSVKSRFSPGYGGVSLEVQKIFFSLLDCKKIGLTLMESLIMAPEKSVTAFVGVKKLNA